MVSFANESASADMEAATSLMSQEKSQDQSAKPPKTWLEEKTGQVKSCLMTTDGQLAVAFLSWVAIGGFALTHLRWGPEKEKFTPIESIYWMAQIITTVGYGDMPPPIHKGGEIFITMYCIAAGLVIAAFVTTLVHKAVDIQESMTSDMISMVTDPSAHAFLERAQTMLTGSPSGRATPEAGPPVPPKEESAPDMARTKSMEPVKGGCAARFYYMLTCQSISRDAMNFFSAFGKWAFCVLVWALFFKFYPGEDKYIVQAFYMAVITLTTIGFGDVTPTTDDGKLFASVMMVVGVTMFAKMVGKFSSWMLTDLTITELTESTLSKILDDRDMKKLMKERKDFFDKKHDDKVYEKCVSRSDFILFMLQDMDLVDEDDVDKLSEHFDTLDRTRNGFLEFEDLKNRKFTRQSTNKSLKRLRRAKTTH